MPKQQPSRDHQDLERKTRFLIERIVQIEMDQKTAQSQLEELSAAKRRFEEERRRMREENAAQQNNYDEGFSHELASMIQHKEEEYLRLKENIDSIRAQISQEADLLDAHLKELDPNAKQDSDLTPPLRSTRSARSGALTLIFGGIVLLAAIVIPTVMYVLPHSSDDIPSAHNPTLAQPKSVETLPRQFRDGFRDGTDRKSPYMLRISAGEFMMGNSADDAKLNEQPAHPRKVREFAISRTEISQRDYRYYAEAQGIQLPADVDGELPVTKISWDDAIKYTNWLSEKTGKVYRLPTEGEWEYAASGGHQVAYSWGDLPEKNRAVCKDCISNGDNMTLTVLQPYPPKSFPDNDFGLFDMSGNVAEWTLNCYESDYSQTQEQVDPVAEAQKTCARRVARGGSFRNPLTELNIHRRFPLASTRSAGDLGFRIVRETTTP